MTHIINVSVANLYNDSLYKSEIHNQALLGEQVEVLSVENDFAFIRQENGCKGWISQYQVCDKQDNDETKVSVISHIIQLFEKPDSNSYPVRDAVIGCKLNLVNEINDWYQILLPDGLKSWVRKIHFGIFPKLSRSNIVKLAKQFLGYPYFWGGRSPRGFDCSGLTQTVFGLLGKQLPRDAYMQRNNTKEISTNISDVREGDLLFFGDDKIKVDHVGIALGENKIIHARGMVRINSLDKTANDYNSKLDETLIGVSSVF